MSALSIQPTYPIFTDIDGQPLEDGYVWIGQANLDPQVNPINVFWDAALTIPAGQPIRTLGGYPSNSGTPARLYVNSDYSIRVMNKNGSVVYSAPTATERYSDVVISGVNAEDVVYEPPFTGGVQTNVEAKLAQTISVKDFGATGDGVADDSAAIQAAIDSGAKSIYFPEGTYLCNVNLTNERVLIGEGTTRSILKPFSTATPVITYRTAYQDWSYCTEISNIGFVSASKTGIGFCYGPADPANYTAGDELVLPVTFRNCLFDNFDKGVLSNYGNIGIDFYSCGFRNNNYGCYFLGDYYALMHAGCKYFYGGEMHGNNCAVYVNNRDQTGSVTFKSTILQYNRIAFYCYSTGSITPHQFIDVWQEGNGIAGGFPSTTTIDTYNFAGVKSTKTIETYAFTVEGSKTKIIVQGGQLNNWHLVGGDCELNAYGSIANSNRVDSFYPNCKVTSDTSSIYLRDCFSTFGYPYGKNIYAIGMAKTHTQVISSTANDGHQRWMTVPHRKIIVDSGVTPNAGVAIPCDVGATFVQMTTVETINGGVVTDGPTYKFSNEFVGTQPVKTNYRLNGNGSNITTTAGYYVFTVAIKQAVNSNAYFMMWSFNVDYFATLIQPPGDDKWYTYAAIGYSPGGQTMYLDAFMDNTNVFRIQAYQVRRFDTYQDAQEFVAQGIYIES